jgi:tripartite-type tricarboxylate transporter receptor subunit TctC
VARANALPDVPTLGEFIPGFEARTWQGLGAPKHLPTEIVDALNKEVIAAFGRAGIASAACGPRYRADAVDPG